MNQLRTSENRIDFIHNFFLVLPALRSFVAIHSASGDKTVAGGESMAANSLLIRAGCSVGLMCNPTDDGRIRNYLPFLTIQPSPDG